MTLQTATGQALEGMDRELLNQFLYEMLLIRRFEEKSGEMYTKGKVRGFLHLYTGQEACAVGALHALRPQDKVLTHYRDHAHAIARGLDPKRVMAELYGRVGGVSGGRGGSMHLYDAEKGFLGGYAIVTAHLPLAVGIGLAFKMRKQDGLTLCVFGDGSVGEGEFHEALNLGQLWKTPVIWFCENNLYGMGVPFKQSLSTEIPKLAAAYGMPAVTVDGMDVLAVHRATLEAAEHCRAGNGPYFIEAMTYRYRGHSMADPELYRLKDEVEEQRKRDAIERLKGQLVEAEYLDELGYQALVDRVEKDVQACVDYAESSPEPGIDTLYDHILRGEDADA